MNDSFSATKNTPRFKTIDMVYIALFSVLIGICSWISIPAAVPFTMQTFAIFLTVAVLGGKKGTASVLLYILMGLVGIPVFSGFKAGPGVLLGTTGGYIIGFIFTALLMWGMEKLLGKRFWILTISMILGLIVCYGFGTAWFMFVYTKNTGAIGLTTVLGWCVIPFLIPDFVKIGLALALGGRLSKIIKIDND